jgi:hypothetical protein
VLRVELNSLAHLVVVRLTVTALEELLADEVDGVRIAAEAARLWIEAQLKRERSDGGVVIGSVIKHEVADRARGDTKLLEYEEYNLSHALTGVSARQLRQRDRQVDKVAVAADVVSDDTKVATLAALCRPTVEAYIGLA